MPMLTQPGLAEKRNFIGEIELGPELIDFKSKPLSILPKDLNGHTFMPLSLWGVLGYKLDKVRILSRLEYYGDSKPYTEREEHFNLAELFNVAWVIEAECFKVNRITVAVNSGYLYSYFRAYPTSNKLIKYKHEDNGPLLGFSSRYLFKKPSIDKDKALRFGDNLSLEFAYEREFTKNLRNGLNLSLYTLYKNIYFFTRFRYINQKYDYGLYALTIGGYGFFGI